MLRSPGRKSFPHQSNGTVNHSHSQGERTRQLGALEGERENIYLFLHKFGTSMHKEMKISKL